MAARLAPHNVRRTHQSLHHLVADSPWSDQDLLAQVRAWALPLMKKKEPVVAWVVDDTGIPKKGKHSVGVARQYCGQLGKQENCQVAVSLSVASWRSSLPIAWCLYLPESWARDRQRRRKAGVPVDVHFQTKPQIALDQIRQALEQEVQPGVVLAGAAYGNDTTFRAELRKLKLEYVVGIQSTTSVWKPGEVPLPPKKYKGQGRPPKLLRRGKQQPLAAGELALTLPAKAWKKLSWRDGAKRQLASCFAWLRVRPAHRDFEQHEAHPEQGLLIEWPRGEAEPAKYWLSNLPAAAVWLICSGLRKHSAALRHVVWALSLAAVAVTPFLLGVTPKLGVPAWALPAPSVAFSSAAREAPAAAVEVARSPKPGIAELGAAEREVAELEAPAAVAAGHSRSEGIGPSVSSASMVLGAWLFGFVISAARLLAGHVRLRLVARRAGKQPDFESLAGRLDVSQEVLFLQPRGEPMPMTWGWKRPKILVPASFEEWDSDRRSMTLLHELAHVRRSDWLTQTLAQVVRAVYWFHPLVWIAVRRIQVEADRACDDKVLQAGSKASGYAEHLVRAARQFSTAGLRPWVAIAMARPSSLDQRVRYVLDEDVDRASLGPRRGLAAAMGVMAIALAIPSVEAVAQADAPLVRPEAAVELAEPVETAGPAGPAAPMVARGNVARRSAARGNKVSVAEGTRPLAEPVAPVETERTLLAQAQPAPQPQRELERAQRQLEDASERLEERHRAAEARMARSAESVERRKRPALSPEALRTAGGALRKALSSPDAEVRSEAAESLGRLGSFEEANLEALGAALSDEEPKVQREAADSLGRLLALDKEMVPERAVRWLMPALSASDTRVRREAVEALGRLRGAAAIEAVTKAMNDANPQVQREAVESLGRLLRSADADAARAALPALEKALQHDDPKVRKQVVESLGRLRVIANEVVPLLAKAAEDPDPGVQKEAVEALGRISSGAGFGAVWGDVLRHEIHEQIEATAAQIEALDIQGYVTDRIVGAIGAGAAVLAGTAEQ